MPSKRSRALGALLRRLDLAHTARELVDQCLDLAQDCIRYKNEQI